MTELGRVFVSYRRADASHLAGRLADRLVEHFEVFMDMDTIDPGTDFTAVIRTAVDACDVMIAVIGPTWATLTDGSGMRRIDNPDDWVVAEIATALQRDVPVMPVLVDGASMPEAGQLPPVLTALASRQAVPVRHETFSTDVERLIAAVQRRLAASDPIAVETPARLSVEPTVPPEPEPEPKAATPVPPRPAPVQYVVDPPRRSAPVLWILLVVGVVLALVVGGVLVLRSGVLGAASPAPSTAATSPTGPTSEAETTGLRAHVPAAIRPVCQAYTPPDTGGLGRDLVEAVRCPLDADGSPANVWYLQYSGKSSTTRAFEAYAQGDFETGSCTGGNRQQLTYSVKRDGQKSPGGTLRCYAGSGKVVNFAWTQDELHIVAFARDDRLSFAAMKEWWQTAGPYLEG